MENKQITIHSITLPEVDAEVESYKVTAFEHATLIGKQSAQRNKLLKLAEYTVLGINPIVALGQATINFARQKAQLWAQVQNTKELEANTVVQCNQLFFEYSEKERQLLPLTKKKEQLKQALPHRDHRLLFRLIAICCGLADFALLYSTLRYALPVYQAVIISLAVGVVISFSHLAYCGWIKKGNTGFQKWFRVSLLLFIAAIIFSGVAVLRVASLNAVVSIDPAAAGTGHTAPMSAVAAAGISFLLFVFVFAVALRFWVRPEDERRITEYKNLCLEVESLEKEIDVLKTKKAQLETDVLIKKAEIRNLATYLKRIIETIKAIATSAREEFKKTYTQFRDEVPDFFAHDEALQFDDDLQLFTDFQKEQLS